MPAKNKRPVTTNKLFMLVIRKISISNPKRDETKISSLLTGFINARARPPNNAPKPSTELKEPKSNSPTENRSSKKGAINARYGKTKMLKIGVMLSTIISVILERACKNTFFAGVFSLVNLLSVVLISKRLEIV